MPRLRMTPEERTALAIEQERERVQQSWRESETRVNQIWNGEPISETPRLSRTAEKGAPNVEWPAPKPLPNGLPKVDAFESEFLPDSLAPWVSDVSDRLQCPPDYVAVAALTALGSVIGRRVGVKPQAKTDWTETPNLWGMFIGRPGMLKSPAMNEALRHIHHLEAEAAKENEIAQQAYAAGLDAYDLRKKVRVSLEKDALKKSKDGAKVEINFDVGEEPKEPLPVRFRTNDSTYEAIGELLVANPNGILVERDELVSLLKHLDRDEQAVARGFYLSGWSGSQPYTFDRILRGHLHIEAVCISVLGNTQPSRIAEYVRRANADGGGGDGLLQRFGLMVWPDSPSDWRNVDEYPAREAREVVRQIFFDASKLTEADALGQGALKGAFDRMPCFRFDEMALGQFLEWRTDLERSLRSGELSPALEGHIAKYRKLVPALALINHIADGSQGDIQETSLLKALAFSKYLETHAHRVYGASDTVELNAAHAILAHIRKGDIGDGFTTRDIHQHDWSGLTDRDHVQAGLSLLADLDHISGTAPPVGPHGGRPKTVYAINPKVRP
jgi:hypothetical protein